MSNVRASVNTLCTETIALLSLLGPEPGDVDASFQQPTPSPFEHEDNRRTLSAEVEKNLAWALSFISTITSDPDDVPTLVVEEDPETHRVTIRLAVSTSEQHRDKPPLTEIKNGLQGVIQFLQETSNDEGGHAENVVLGRLIGLCQQRMLRILGSSQSQHTRTVDEVGTVSLLTQAKAVLGRRSLSDEEGAALFVQGIGQIISFLQDLERIGITDSSRFELLARIILVTSDLTGSVDIGSLLDSISKNEMDVASKEEVKKVLEAMAGYKKAAGILVDHVRAYPLFGIAVVRPVVLAPTAFEFLRPEPIRPVLLESAVRRVLGIPSGRNPPRIRQLAEIGWTTAQSRFKSAFAAVRKNGHIHGTMQLIAHYELQPAKLPPRFIMSTEPPCPLCRLFATRHGKYQFPEGPPAAFNRFWRLPAIGLDDRLLQSFNSLLENATKRLMVDGPGSAVASMQRARVTRSVTSSVAPSSGPVALPNRYYLPGVATATEAPTDNASEGSLAGSPFSRAGKTFPEGLPSPLRGRDAHPASTGSTYASGAAEASNHGNAVPEALARATNISGIVTSTAPSVTYTMPDIRLTFDYVGGAGTSRQGRRKAVRFTVELVEEREDTTEDLIDLDSVGDEDGIGGDKQFTLLAKSSIVRIVGESVAE